MRSWNTVRYSPACAGRCRSRWTRIKDCLKPLSDIATRARSAARTSTCRTRRRRRRHEQRRREQDGLRASPCAQAEAQCARRKRAERRLRARPQAAEARAPRWRAPTAVSPAAQGARTPARAPIRALCPHPVAHTLSSRASVGDLPAGGAEERVSSPAAAKRAALRRSAGRPRGRPLCCSGDVGGHAPGEEGCGVGGSRRVCCTRGGRRQGTRERERARDTDS